MLTGPRPRRDPVMRGQPNATREEGADVVGERRRKPSVVRSTHGDRLTGTDARAASVSHVALNYRSAGRHAERSVPDLSGALSRPAEAE